MEIHETSVFHTSSPQARAIADLFYFDLAICAFIFLLVTGLIVFVVVRFRHKPGAPEPVQDPGNAKLETLWTVIPGLILAVLLGWTAYTMHFVNPPIGSREPDVIIIAHQWWWEYHYPTSGVVTANELHMPLGQNWLFKVESADVIHNFWVPDLAAKTDAIPGHPNFLWIKPDHGGIFLGTCGEYCGCCHGLMGIRVIVDSPEEFEQWLKSQQVTARTPTTEPALRGLHWVQSRTCGNCHTIAGTTARGKVAPDLTHMATRQTLGANTTANTHANLVQWIRDPRAIKPGVNMPGLRASPQEAEDIATYLEELK